METFTPATAAQKGAHKKGAAELLILAQLEATPSHGDEPLAEQRHSWSQFLVAMPQAAGLEPA